MKNRKLFWTICCGLVLLLLVLTYTPAFTPHGQVEPTWNGIPYTMWLGFVESIILLFLVFIGTRFHPGRDED